MVALIVFFTVLFSERALCLENGLAKTPPMGWLSWGRFQCITDCEKFPDRCISENLFMEMADKLVQDGYRDVGYEYVIIDDCWMSKYRSIHGNLMSDPLRFPNGIEFLSYYMHNRDLKLGIYANFGTKTCMGYPGSLNHLEQDAKRFASFKVDMVKFDGCYSDPNILNEGYMGMGSYLNKTGRPMLFSCSWPYYQLLKELEPDYSLISSHCNMWRNHHDVQDSWQSIIEIIDFFGDNQEVLSQFIGPGKWADPDMLMIGNFDLTPGQARAQMAVWAILPAPLLMSNDLRNTKSDFRRILLNKGAISINQDQLGLPGKRVYKENDTEIWVKKILPVFQEETSFAILFLNRHPKKKAFIVLSLHELGLKVHKSYVISDVFNNYVIKPTVHLFTEMIVRPNDVVLLNCKLVS